MTDATLAEIRTYPIKSLDGVAVDSARIGPGGGLATDRTVALVDENGEYVNGKREQAIHRIDATFDRETGTVTLAGSDPADAPSGTVPDTETFAVAGFGSDDSAAGGDHDELAAWVSTYLGYDVFVRDEDPSYPDDTSASGPTLVSRATLSTVAGWFDGLDATDILRRFRVNLVVERPDGKPFWEDRLYGDTDEHVEFAVGDTVLAGVGPCRRCVVPTRDPDTGVATANFQERFVEKRRETLPEWSDGPRFDGAFRLTVNTLVPERARGATLRVGDDVEPRGAVER